VLALKSTLYEHAAHADAWLGLLRAKDAGSFDEVLQRLEAPSLDVLFAYRSRNIGYRLWAGSLVGRRETDHGSSPDTTISTRGMITCPLATCRMR
jgi:hypothetical protein